MKIENALLRGRLRSIAEFISAEHHRPRLQGDSPGITDKPFASSMWSTVGEPIIEVFMTASGPVRALDPPQVSGR